MSTPSPISLGDLVELEIELQQPTTRCDRERLEALLHPDFFEFGRSGGCYTRADVLAALSTEGPAVKAHSENFAVHVLGPHVALLTYTSAEVGVDESSSRLARRSSVWRRDAAGWRLVFHQATPTEG